MTGWIWAAAMAVSVAGYVLFVPSRGTRSPESLAHRGGMFITVNGACIHYLRQGAKRPGFVLIHGFGAGTFSWRRVMDFLAGQGDVVAYDRPGFGLSERPIHMPSQSPNPYGHSFQVSLIPALMDALGLDTATLIAHSAGARIALDCARMHPDRVDALVLVAPVFDDGHLKRHLPSWISGAVPSRIGPYLLRPLAYLLPAILARAWHDPRGPTDDVTDGYATPLRVRGWERGLWGVLTSDGPDNQLLIASLHLPVLVVAGSGDRIASPRDAHRLAGDIPRARLVELHKCGHLPHEERPEALVEAMEIFLREIGAAPD